MSKKIETFSVGKQLPDNPDIDMQFLSAPIKSAVDKYQLVPEFLKVSQLFIYHISFPVYQCMCVNGYLFMCVFMYKCCNFDVGNFR